MEDIGPFIEENSIHSTPETATKTRRKKKNIKWNFSRKFADKTEAIDYVKQEKTWSFWYRNDTADGRKISLFNSGSNHTCFDKTNISRLSEEAKQEINCLIDLKIKPKRIFQILKKKKFNVRNQVQVNNYIQQLRRKEGPSRISLSELEDWCVMQSST
ncbi:hypothetical protein BLOT_012385 [Blomia tropicalis]|nr:hypothetical protein BLOT_012385 [Blomia tropicalis]